MYILSAKTISSSSSSSSSSASSSTGFDYNAGVGASSKSVGHSPGNWLAAHRANLTLGKTDICIFGAKFYGRMPFLSPTHTLSAVQELRLFPTDLGCVLHRWHHEIVVLFRWTTANAPGRQSVDSRCDSTATQVVTG